MNMKKYLAFFLAIAMSLTLCSCIKSKAAQNADELIEAIGEVTIESEEKINAAQEA